MLTSEKAYRFKRNFTENGTTCRLFAALIAKRKRGTPGREQSCPVVSGPLARGDHPCANKYRAASEDTLPAELPDRRQTDQAVDPSSMIWREKIRNIVAQRDDAQV
jgi:hypothetical protein